MPRTDEVDPFVVYARDSHMIPPRESVPWILQTKENLVYTPGLTNASFMSKFNILKSYRLDTDFPRPFVLLPELTLLIAFRGKTGFIISAFTHCEAVRT